MNIISQQDILPRHRTLLPKKIIINLSGSSIKYQVIRNVAKDKLKWKIQEDCLANNWDIFWTDNAISQDMLSKMENYQRVNHFPGMYILSRKNNLAKHLMQMRKKFPQEYKFSPLTWIVPYELNELRKNQDNKKSIYIIKPEASCQGKGIYLSRNIENLKEQEHMIVQKYLKKPYLIDKLKFDIRLYVLLTGCDPLRQLIGVKLFLRIYLFKDGLARFATEEYQNPSSNNFDNRFMHLTNYAVNKENPKFVYNQSQEQMNSGHKRSFRMILKQLEEEGKNIYQLMENIKDLIVKTLCSGQAELAHCYRSSQCENLRNDLCFQILGFDILLDHKCKLSFFSKLFQVTPYLLEINHTPSFTTDTPLDIHIKSKVIEDALRIQNLSQQKKCELISEKKKELQERVMTGKKKRLSLDEKKQYIETYQKQRDLEENNNLGEFEKLYPLNVMSINWLYFNQEEQIQNYQKFIEYSQELFLASTGANIHRNFKKLVTENKQDQKKKSGNRWKDIEKLYSPAQKELSKVKGKIDTNLSPNPSFRISNTSIARKRNHVSQIQMDEQQLKYSDDDESNNSGCKTPQLKFDDALSLFNQSDDEQQQYQFSPLKFKSQGKIEIMNAQTQYKKSMFSRFHKPQLSQIQIKYENHSVHSQGKFLQPKIFNAMFQQPSKKKASPQKSQLDQNELLQYLMNINIEGFDKINQFYLILTHNSLPQTRLIFNQNGIHFIFNLRGFLEEKYLDKGSTYIRILPSFFDTYTHSNDSIYKDFINVNSNLTSETIQEIKLKNQQLSSMGLYLDSRPLIQCLKIIKSNIKSISIKFSYIKVEQYKNIQLMLKLTAELQEGNFILDQIIEGEQNWRKIDEFCSQIENEQQSKTYYQIISLDQQIMSQINHFVKNLSFELIFTPDLVSVMPIFSKDNSIMSISKTQLKEYDHMTFSQFFKKQCETIYVDGDLNRLLNLQQKLKIKSRISVLLKDDQYFMRIDSDTEDSEFIIVGKQTISLKNEENDQKFEQTEQEEDIDDWDIDEIDNSINQMSLNEEKKVTEEYKYWKDEPLIFKKS